MESGKNRDMGVGLGRPRNHEGHMEQSEREREREKSLFVRWVRMRFDWQRTLFFFFFLSLSRKKKDFTFSLFLSLSYLVVLVYFACSTLAFDSLITPLFYIVGFFGLYFCLWMEICFVWNVDWFWRKGSKECVCWLGFAYLKIEIVGNNLLWSINPIGF